MAQDAIKCSIFNHLSETSTTERSLKDLYIEGIQSINFWNFLSLYCVGLRDISQRDISQRDIS